MGVLYEQLCSRDFQIALFAGREMDFAATFPYWTLAILPVAPL